MLQAVHTCAQPTHELASHRALLLRRAQRLTKSVADADDLVQSTLERALVHLQTFHPGTNMAAWLSRIMWNLFVDCYRRNGRTIPLSELNEPAAPEHEERPAWEHLSAADIIQAATALPAPLRRVFELNHVTGLSYAEIADVVGIPLRTVGTRLLHARRKLKTILQQPAANDVPVTVVRAPARAATRPASYAA